MTQEKLKQFLDACFDAKRLIEKLPDLPDGMKPRQVHVLDAVNEIQKKQGFCRVSDISSYMNTTLPSITKLVQELEERNLLVKQADEKDKRVINLTLTELLFTPFIPGIVSCIRVIACTNSSTTASSRSGRRDAHSP